MMNRLDEDKDKEEEIDVRDGVRRIVLISRISR